MRRLSTVAEPIRASRSVLALLVSWTAACGGDGASPTPPPPPPPPPPAVASLVINAGDQQQAAGGAPVAIAPAVLVRNAQGGPVAGVTVQFTVLEGGGSVAGGSPTSDAAGVARVTGWTLGPSGTQRLRAQVAGLPAVEFQATLIPGTETIAATLPGSGGTYQITTHGHPFQGLTLTVPAGTYPSGNSVLMLVLPDSLLPTLPPLPAGFSVRGPVLAIDTQEPRGAKLMTLDVPVTRAANEEVLIAFYDPTRRIIEVLPTVARTPTSVRVMTGHLRADLMIGRPLPAAAPAAGIQSAGVTFSGPRTAYLLRVSFGLPLSFAPPVLNPDVDGWPVIDHGSSYFPAGHGPAIPGFVGLSAALSAGLAQKVVPLPRPGFYADAAPLAAVVEGRRRLSGLGQTINQLTEELAKTNKALRDEMVHLNLVGGMQISGNSSIAALMPTQGLEPVFVNTVSGTETTISAINPAEAALVQVNRVLAQGFSPLSVLPSGDQPSVSVDQVVPLPSFVFPGEALSFMVPGLVGVLDWPLGSPQREAGNLDMSNFAGFPTGGMDILPFLGSPWRPTSSGTPIAIRGPSAGLRRASPFSPPGFIMNSLPSLAEVGSVGPGGGFVSTAWLADFAAAPELAQLQYIITPTGNAVGGTKQTGSFTITLVKAPFKVTPVTVDLPADRKVDLVAEVPFPPGGGFWIKWDWGDGTPPFESLGLLSASHTYAQAADYLVRVTLQDNTAGRESLAEIVVVVEGQVGEPFWRITSLLDPDDFLPRISPLGTLFNRILAEPNSGLIAIDDEGGGRTVVRLRVLQNGLWGLGNCCPPTVAPLPGELQQTLGIMPQVQHTVGPYFAGWNITSWAQSTTDLNAGTLTGQYVDGLTTYPVNVGSGVGPGAVLRITGNRTGTAMTGVISLTGWSIIITVEGVLLDPVPRTFEFPFTAVRLR